MASNAAKYLSSGVGRVHGWLFAESAKTIVKIAEIQKRIGVRGSAAEIGVHHGKLFILLALLLESGERCLAIDVFGDQHLNTDQSGRGDKDIFLSNLARHLGRQEEVDVLQESSLKLTADQLTEGRGKFRLFSVDGGHTAECARNDLELADATLADGGVVILDDFFNESWPGVATGTAEFMLSGRSQLVPFAVSPGKVYLSRSAYAAQYIAELSHDASAVKHSEMFGRPVVLLNIPRLEGLERIRMGVVGWAQEVLPPQRYDRVRAAYWKIRKVVGR